jgi:hypothetical protein
VTPDALLIALAETRRRRDRADEYIRTLLAYARELTSPRPYRLADLAEATGMSISGVRTAYTQADIDRAAAMPVSPDSPTFRDFWHAMTVMPENARTRSEPD